jgi:endonuclease G, mitochondrial
MTRLILLLLLLAAPAGAQEVCPQHFTGGIPPGLAAKQQVRARLLCYQAFAVIHSGLTRTGLAAAERLTTASVAAARAVPGRGSFHAEPRLPPDERAELADYDGAGFDRGHLAPSGDMPDPAADRESFTLANMAPQVPSLNRGLWARIEAQVQREASLRGLLYVVTGPAFVGAELESVGHVLVPTHLWKAIYDPARRQAGVYLVPNAAGATWRQISLNQLAAMTGVTPFPGLTARAMTLKGPRR